MRADLAAEDLVHSNHFDGSGRLYAKCGEIDSLDGVDGVVTATCLEVERGCPNSAHLEVAPV